MVIRSLDLPAVDPDDLEPDLPVPKDPPRGKPGRPRKGPPPNVEAAKRKLLLLTEQLGEATSETLPDLLREIQVARVTWLLLEEVHSGEADPQTLRELSSLNKLITGKELGGETADPAAENEARSERARAFLASQGLSGEGAARAVRVLESVMGVPDHERRHPPEPPGG